MEDLVIHHKKKQRFIWLILGVAFLILGIVGMLYIEGESLGFSFGMGITYVGFGLYMWYKPYVQIKDNVLLVSSVPFRKIKLTEIDKIKHFLDETTIIANGKETMITTLQMAEEDKEQFLAYMKKLETLKSDQLAMS